MTRRGLAPGHSNTWNMKISSLIVRTRIDSIRDEIARELGRDPTYTEVLEAMCSQWERTRP